MSISLEQIDEMRKRTNCSYEEAKELLEKNNGDLLEAIVDFEKRHRGQFNRKKDSNNNTGTSFGEKMHDLIQKGFKTRFIIEKDKNILINLSVNVLILIILFTLPIFWFYPIAVILAYLLGCRIKIKKNKGGDIDINKMVENVGNNSRTGNAAASEKAEKEDNKVEVKKDDDDYNEITVE